MEKRWPAEFVESLDPAALPRDETVRVINDIVRVRTHAQKVGLLAVESIAVGGEYDEFFSAGLMMVCNGTDPGVVFHQMFERITTESKDDAERLRRTLYLEGVLCIQAGEDADATATRLGHLLGLGHRQ